MKEIRELVPPTKLEPATELERPFEPQIVPAQGRYQSYRNSYAPEGFQLLDYWRAVRKRIWLVAGIAVLVTTVVAIYMARKPNIFVASSVVQVDNEQTNPDLVTNDRQRPLSNQDPSYFNTQLQLLTSDTLLRRVVKEHNLDANKEFQAAKTAAESSALRSLLRSVGLANDKNSNSQVPGGDAGSTLVSAEEIADAIRLSPYVELLRNNLSVDPIRESRATYKDTRLIQVSYLDSSPDLAAFIANAIGETFSKVNQEKRSGTSGKTSDFLSKRINDLQTDIRTDEIKLVELQQSEGILKTEGDQTIVLDRLTGLNRQLLEAENLRKTAEAKYFAVKDSPESIKSLAEAESARYITEREASVQLVRNDIQKKINEISAERAKKLQEYKEKAPEIAELDKQIDDLNASLQQLVDKNTADIKGLRDRVAKTLVDNLRTAYLQARDQESKIRSAYNEQYNEAQGQSSGAVQIKLLEQTIETNRGFLDNLRKQQSGNDVVSQGSDNNITVASFAIPPETPVAPRRLLTVSMALMLSTLFGIGLALFLEYLDDSIRTTDEVEQYLQLPALAAIPGLGIATRRKQLMNGKNGEPETNGEMTLDGHIFADPRSSLAESYRQLRTSILLSTAGHPPKTLLITSSLPSEGKTTTATNTALSLAQTGAKVLVVDADMRKPRVHSVFNATNGHGLSTVLSSNLSRQEILDLIKYDEKTSLNIMTSGPIPPNPAELIGSQQMERLLITLQDEFTHVIVDSPPIGSFTDGVLLASMVDGVILVIESGKSSRVVSRRTRQMLADVRAKVLGVVLNNVDLSNQSDYYYYQSYMYRSDYRQDDISQ